MLDLLAVLIGLPLAVMLLTALLNIPFLLRLRPATQAADAPSVSILIPARNEAQTIAATIGRLRRQQVGNFELLVLDDNSEDDTAQIAQQAFGGDRRCRLLRGQPLPPGWLGKNWACQQLATAARGDLLIFSDADVLWQPQALAALLQAFAQSGADVITVWPTQLTVGAGERLVVPLMALATIAYLPHVAVHYTPWSLFAAANGQCLALRKAAYHTIGGHRQVAGEIVEDVALARLAKRKRLRLRMFDGNGLICCRMYRSWPEVRDGFAKNILAGHGNSVALLALSTIFHLLIFVVPLLWLLLAPALGSDWLWPLLLLGIGVAVRMLTALLTRQRPLDGMLMPLSALLMTRIAWQALVWQRSGGPRWRGRAL